MPGAEGGRLPGPEPRRQLPGQLGLGSAPVRNRLTLERGFTSEDLIAAERLGVLSAEKTVNCQCLSLITAPPVLQETLMDRIKKQLREWDENLREDSLPSNPIGRKRLLNETKNIRFLN